MVKKVRKTEARIKKHVDTGRALAKAKKTHRGQAERSPRQHKVKNVRHAASKIMRSTRHRDKRDALAVLTWSEDTPVE